MVPTQISCAFFPFRGFLLQVFLWPPSNRICFCKRLLSAVRLRVFSFVFIFNVSKLYPFQ